MQSNEAWRRSTRTDKRRKKAPIQPVSPESASPIKPPGSRWFLVIHTRNHREPGGFIGLADSGETGWIGAFLRRLSVRVDRRHASFDCIPHFGGLSEKSE